MDVWLTTTLLRDEAGKPVAIATTERDITERKRAEEEISRFRDVSSGEAQSNLAGWAHWDNHLCQRGQQFAAAPVGLHGRQYLPARLAGPIAKALGSRGRPDRSR